MIYFINEGPQHRIWVGTENGLGIPTKDPTTSSDDPTSIINSDFRISLNPNPAKDFVQISSSKPLVNPRLEIITTSGDVIMKETKFGSFNAISLNVHEIKSGLYFLKIETLHGSVVKKMVLQR